MERLHNEITRMPTLKAIAAIASSPLKVDLTTVLSDVVTELGQFLRQHSR
jgi:cullin-associated NEDD8-dissociated protein 1